ncbi:MAG: CalY family protein, partial [Clostridia bacterium]|nr:CalY family protein [Clostridia bacterium]
MKSKKAVRSALGMSVLSIALCAAMLIGTTFAWFTDTATTSVNKIQSGTLDIALEMKDNEGKWVSAEGKTL